MLAQKCQELAKFDVGAFQLAQLSGEAMGFAAKTGVVISWVAA